MLKTIGIMGGMGPAATVDPTFILAKSAIRMAGAQIRGSDD